MLCSKTRGTQPKESRVENEKIVINTTKEVISMTFLDDFYYGNIRPADNEFIKKSEFDNALKAFCNCESELRKVTNAINK